MKSKWFLSLNKSEREHLKELHITSLQDFQEVLKFTQELEHHSRCWVCISIGHKLKANGYIDGK